MAERTARVAEVSAGRAVLRLLGDRCRECSAGCGGRCNVFAADEAGSLSIATEAFGPGDIGREVVLRLDDAALRRAAWSGYGRALVGLMIGTGVGAVVGLGFPAARDPLTLIGLLSGTFIAIAFHNPRNPEPQLIDPPNDKT